MPHPHSLRPVDSRVQSTTWARGTSGSRTARHLRCSHEDRRMTVARVLVLSASAPAQPLSHPRCGRTHPLVVIATVLVSGASSNTCRPPAGRGTYHGVHIHSNHNTAPWGRPARSAILVRGHRRHVGN